MGCYKLTYENFGVPLFVSANNFTAREKERGNKYDLEFRNYDPALARMNQVDPMADKYASFTPYNYSFNAPSNFNDVNGADPTPKYDPDYAKPRNLGEFTSNHTSLWGNNYTITGAYTDNTDFGILFNSIWDSGFGNVGGIANGNQQMYDFYRMTSDQYVQRYGQRLSSNQASSMWQQQQAREQREIQRSKVASGLIASLKGGWLEGAGAGTPWMKFAKQYFDAGLRECRTGNLSAVEVIKMEADNNTILSMLNDVGGGRNGLTSSSDLNAWCASFVNRCLALAGIKGTDSPGAGSFIGYGTEICEPVYGAIGVQVNKNGIVTHVGFYAGESGYAPLPVSLLGGNQRDGTRVAYSNMSTYSFIYWCMPTGYGSGN